MRVTFFLCILSFLCVLSLECIQKTTADIEEEAIVQILDFFDKQNKLFERQKRYEFLKVMGIKRLDRKRTEVTLQYRFIDKYMTVDRTEEIKQATFLFRWEDKGKLVVPPEGKAQRVRWVLSKTWEYNQETG